MTFLHRSHKRIFAIAGFAARARVLLRFRRSEDIKAQFCERAILWYRIVAHAKREKSSFVISRRLAQKANPRAAEEGPTKSLLDALKSNHHEHKTFVSHRSRAGCRSSS
jgi:hypothetical protein